MFDLVHLAIRDAVRLFDGSGESRNVFNAAGFSQAMCKRANLVNATLDGHLVDAILCGRDDVEQLSGGAHYRLIEVTV